MMKTIQEMNLFKKKTEGLNNPSSFIFRQINILYYERKSYQMTNGYGYVVSIQVGSMK